MYLPSVITNSGFEFSALFLPTLYDNRPVPIVTEDESQPLSS